MNLTKKVILESDDFGITPGVSQATLELLRAGKISTTNCMPTMPEFQESVNLLSNEAERTMGIHLILDRHSPALPANQISSITNQQGMLLSFAEIQKKIKLKQVDYAEISAELEAQINRAQAAGVKIDHLTTHHGFMNLSVKLFEVVCQLADQYHLPIRNNLTHLPREQATGLKKIADKYQLKMPQHHFMISGVVDPIDKLVAEIDRLPADEILEVVSHVGRSDALLQARSSYTTIREEDYRTLDSKELAKKLAQRKVELVDFSSLEKN
ncbi:carbohydrate deacetylase [Ligilactobacillus pabuli]|uniref:Carbohydrate deacetylase n=1 Tax=Ligilactobacillus pabuli TaxID=2886039 RepID=A0ABQ5JHI9_9LACO|nr:ChbG/HpnK family deacetylase [Ligilactobacillus pabuli]GKS80594.1 carbohydrate deacetylase [Ligilactobacillus pabuli]